MLDRSRSGRAIAAGLAVLASPVAAEAAGERLGPRITVGSTAYCLWGTMANGRGVHGGAVASNMHPLGTLLKVRYRLQIGKYRRKYFRVEDRIGHGSQLDLWMPSCGSAFAWGRRSLRYRVVLRRHRP